MSMEQPDLTPHEPRQFGAEQALIDAACAERETLYGFPKNEATEPDLYDRLLRQLLEHAGVIPKGWILTEDADRLILINPRYLTEAEKAFHLVDVSIDEDYDSAKKELSLSIRLANRFHPIDPDEVVQWKKTFVLAASATQKKQFAQAKHDREMAGWQERLDRAATRTKPFAVADDPFLRTVLEKHITLQPGLFVQIIPETDGWLVKEYFMKKTGLLHVDSEHIKK